MTNNIKQYLTANIETNPVNESMLKLKYLFIMNGEKNCLETGIYFQK